MDIEEKIGKLSSAEEFFRYFDLPFEPAVLRVSRLHIMKRFGMYLQSHPCDSDAGKFEHSRALLERAYSDFVQSSPMAERVFKVHQSATRSPQAPLVSISLKAD